MKITATLLSCIAALSAFTDPAAAGPLRNWQPFLSHCHSASLRSNHKPWTLEAECTMDGQKFTRELNLDRCLVNQNAHVRWGRNGKFSSSCSGCEVRHGSWLYCQCLKPNGSLWHSSTPHLNLNDHIEFSTTTRQLHCDSVF